MKREKREKKKREREKGRSREQEKKRKSEKRKARKEKKRKRDQENKRRREQENKRDKKRETEKKNLKKSQNPKNLPDELSHHDSKKKKNRRKELFGIFSSKVQNLTRFSINSMIRIRFSGSQELNWKAFSVARYLLNQKLVTTTSRCGAQTRLIFIVNVSVRSASPTQKISENPAKTQENQLNKPSNISEIVKLQQNLLHASPRTTPKSINVLCVRVCVCPRLPLQPTNLCGRVRPLCFQPMK